ncbi:MAG TPA: ribose-phosphate pyrophosphokinase [Acidimicrobiia bacterium]
MTATLVGGSGNPPLLAATAHALAIDAESCLLERFPDGETHVVLSRPQRGKHVFIVQPTGPPVDAHLVELVMLADACRRSGAAHITAVVPYFGYARQDRRGTSGEAIGAKAAARLIEGAGIDQLMVVDPHSTALETMFDIPVETLSAVRLLAGAVRPLIEAPAVVVAPDLGAVKLAERYAVVLDLPVAIVRKTRVSGETVRATDVVGDVRGRQPLIVDDMITTAGTVEAAAQALLERGCRPEIVVAATHGLFVGPAALRLAALPLRNVVVTDSLPAVTDFGVPVAVVGIQGALADAILASYRS